MSLRWLRLSPPHSNTTSTSPRCTWHTDQIRPVTGAVIDLHLLDATGEGAVLARVADGQAVDAHLYA